MCLLQWIYQNAEVDLDWEMARGWATFEIFTREGKIDIKDPAG